MNDILPQDSHTWLYIEDILRAWLKSYGYANIRTPIVENTSLFVRSIGDVTDIVEKEMYTFTDKLNNDSLTLRPEGTVGVLRCAIEHNLLYNSTCKLWYMGPMFRHERPQKGRYRQFHQLGVEALGFSTPEIDAEILLMQHDLWKRLGIDKHVSLHLNCLGQSSERALYKEALIKYFEQHIDLLDDDSKRRLYTNPLRILDSKNESIQKIVANAPKMIDYLGHDSLKHHNQVKDLLSSMGIVFIENPNLVRGLDYYNLTVFEWVGDALGAQSTVSGGGRYDPLVEQLGGSENFAIGFAIGIERLILMLSALNLLPEIKDNQVFIACYSNNEDIKLSQYAFSVAQTLRNAGYSVTQNLSNRSFKSQLKKADNLKCSLVIVIGENELNTNTLMVKCMASKEQVLVNAHEILEFVQGLE